MTRRIRALDGLRGLAVLLVVAAHAGIARLATGAWIGVSTFFVLSGFLITRSLLTGDRIDLKRFWSRRVRRLLPALTAVVTVGFVAGWVTGFHSLLALTYTTNFYIAANPAHYPLNHTWTLAVEEHFYLVWPILLIVFRRRLMPAVWVLVAAVGWRIAMIAEGANWYRLHRGTDAIAFTLLIGCVLALARHHGKLRPTSPFLGSMGVVALIFMSMHPGQLTHLGQFGFELVAAVVAALIVNAQHVPVLEHQPLMWVGTISYGLYLWHGMFYQVFAWNQVSILLLSVAVATASWYLMERPVMGGNIPRLVQRRAAPATAATAPRA